MRFVLNILDRGQLQIISPPTKSQCVCLLTQFYKIFQTAKSFIISTLSGERERVHSTPHYLETKVLRIMEKASTRASASQFYVYLLRVKVLIVS